MQAVPKIGHDSKKNGFTGCPSPTGTEFCLERQKNIWKCSDLHSDPILCISMELL